jgi:hypothetical protein
MQANLLCITIPGLLSVQGDLLAFIKMRVEHTKAADEARANAPTPPAPPPVSTPAVETDMGVESTRPRIIVLEEDREVPVTGIQVSGFVELFPVSIPAPNV